MPVRFQACDATKLKEKERVHAQIHGCPIVGMLHSMKATHRSSRCDENGYKLVAHKLEEAVRGTPSDTAAAM